MKKIGDNGGVQTYAESRLGVMKKRYNAARKNGFKDNTIDDRQATLYTERTKCNKHAYRLMFIQLEYVMLPRNPSRTMQIYSRQKGACKAATWRDIRK